MSGAVRGSDYISVSLSYSSENLSSGRKTSALRLFIGLSGALVRLLGCCGRLVGSISFIMLVVHDAVFHLQLRKHTLRFPIIHLHSCICEDSSGLCFKWMKTK